MTTGNIMPLIMSFTPSTKIQEETNPFEYAYNDEEQIIAYDMRIVGTKSLKTSQTRKPCSAVGCGYVNHPDKKNEIDDQKNVN